MRLIGINCLVAVLFFTSICNASDQNINIDIQFNELQKTIHNQQLQIQQQAVQIKGQAEQLQSQQELLLRLEQQLDTLINQLNVKPLSGAESISPPQPDKVAQQPLPNTITSGNDKIKLTLSGQINRAMNVVGDGGNTEIYHVDNNVSNSRFRLKGISQITDDLTLGTRLEMTFTADESSKVSQIDRTPGNYLNARWVDITLESKTYGKLSMGKGDTASYNTASVDLSKTDVIQYSSVADIVGGLFFRKKNGLLTQTAVADVFTDFDGLGAKSRFRYDTPTFKGFSLAGSLVSSQGYDIALYWDGEGDFFHGSGAFALSNPKLPDSGLQFDGSFSLLHTQSGLNLTLSSGMLEKKSTENAQQFYAKLGWQTNLTKMGYTAFGIDHSLAENIAATGDRGTSIGAAIVQEFRKAATEMYFQYRVYQLKTGDNTSVNDINVGTLGIKVKF